MGGQFCTIYKWEQGDPGGKERVVQPLEVVVVLEVAQLLANFVAMRNRCIDLRPPAYKLIQVAEAA